MHRGNPYAGCTDVRRNWHPQSQICSSQLGQARFCARSPSPVTLQIGSSRTAAPETPKFVQIRALTAEFGGDFRPTFGPLSGDLPIHLLRAPDRADPEIVPNPRCILAAFDVFAAADAQTAYRAAGCKLLRVRFRSSGQRRRGRRRGQLVGPHACQLAGLLSPVRSQVSGQVSVVGFARRLSPSLSLAQDLARRIVIGSARIFVGNQVDVCVHT